MCELGRRVRRSRGPNRGRGGSYRRGRGKSQVSGGWGWDGNALPIGTQGWPGGRGEEGAPASGRARVGEPPRAHPHAGRGGGLAAGGCPPPLPRPAHKGARGPRFLLAPLPSPPEASGPRRSRCHRGGISGPRVPAGVVRQ